MCNDSALVIPEQAPFYLYKVQYSRKNTQALREKLFFFLSSIINTELFTNKGLYPTL